MGRSVHRRAALVAGAALWVAGSLACNAILGNEPVSLEPPPSSGRDATPDVTSNSDASCSGDLTTDRKNCGACGHDCLEGACDRGVCQPFVVTTSPSPPTLLAVDEAGNVFFASVDGTIRRCTVPRCDAPTVVTRLPLEAGSIYPSGMVARGGVVYVAEQASGTIFMCAATGCAAPSVLVSGFNTIFGLAVDDTSIYFASILGSFVARCALPACAGGPIKMTQRAGYGFLGVVQDDANVYFYRGPFSDAGNYNPFTTAAVERLPKNAADAAPATLATGTFATNYYSNVAVRGDTLFIGESRGDAGAGSGVLSRVSLTAPGAPVPIVSNAAPFASLVVGERDAYWLSYADGHIRRCSIDGCAAPSIVTAAGEARYGVVQSSTAVYWSENTSSRIAGVAK
ncbi:MAG: hypothetical protein JNL38_30465 [Myxococcales bacterium]|nr:hypothetical protein [Myxococcales bacterium]